MITGGIDMGLEYIKAVIMKDGSVLARAQGRSGGARRAENAERVWNEALVSAGLQPDEVERLAVTGKGKYDVPFAQALFTEPVCIARAASAAVPGATAVLDVGADSMTALTLGGKGKITEMEINQKCSAGCGLMLEVIADRLGLSLEELSGAEAGSAKVSDGCMVFAELDALSLMNRGFSKTEVAAALNRSAAVRAAVVYNDITLRDDGCVVLTGGVAGNAAFARALEARLGLALHVPEHPEYCTAEGAALLAAGE